MEQKNMNRIGIAMGIIGLAALTGAGVLYMNARNVPHPAATAPEESHGKAEGGKAEGEEQEDGHDSHGHGESEAEISDLDRPVDELWAARCEHDIPQFECDECRYELGAVKLAPDLFGGKGKAGLVAKGRVEMKSFAESLALTGEVRMSESRTAHIASPMSGVIRRVAADIGTRVTAGDVLIEIDSHDVAEARASLRKALASVDLARKTAEREEKLFEKKISAGMEVEEARARLAEAEMDLANARARLARMGVEAAEADRSEMSGLLAVRAPANGVVIEKHGVAGEYVEQGKDLFLLSDLSEVWVWADLKEADVQALGQSGGRNIGQAGAEVEEPGTGRIHRGSVDIVSGLMDEETRTVRARIVLDNPDGSLRPGMFVRVRMLLPGGRKAMAVPRVAVLADEGRPFVFVQKAGDFWIRRSVSMGMRSETDVEILDGLVPGQTIVADGSFLLKSDVLKKKMGAGCAD